MKTALTLLVIVIAVLACGCTSQAPTAAPAATPYATLAPAVNTATPDLVGSWTGTTVGHNSRGFVTAGKPTFNITMQKGFAFVGNKDYADLAGVIHHEEFSGVINKQGEIYIAEKEAGMIVGDLIGPDSMELVYIEDGDEAMAYITILNRQKS